jgi:hypothetical protein
VFYLPEYLHRASKGAFGDNGVLQSRVLARCDDAHARFAKVSPPVPSFRSTRSPRSLRE